MMGLAEMKADTDAILAEWGETLTVKRLVDPTYDDEGKAIVTDDQWTQIPAGETIVGDWQPLPGSAIIEEQGLEVKSEAQIIVAFDADIETGDRISKGDDPFMYVNYVRRYEDHCTVRLTKTEVTT